MLASFLCSQDRNYPHFTRGETEAPCCDLPESDSYFGGGGMALKFDFTPKSYAIYRASPLPSCRIASTGGRTGEERGMAVKKDAGASAGGHTLLATLDLLGLRAVYCAGFAASCSHPPGTIHRPPQPVCQECHCCCCFISVLFKAVSFWKFWSVTVILPLFSE